MLPQKDSPWPTGQTYKQTFLNNLRVPKAIKRRLTPGEAPRAFQSKGAQLTYAEAMQYWKGSRNKESAEN